ncbi:hypothetical protein AB0N05_07825 [Nocardia sp. NPDC051030]|uniref:hypothetical protein n=1 Tax=Nocardia sp. NPDC051030 TaxID=3155162 RepID=UPI00343DBE9A
MTETAASGTKSIGCGVIAGRYLWMFWALDQLWSETVGFMLGFPGGVAGNRRQMRTENINRKFKLHDERRIAAQLPEQLQGLDVVGFVRVDEFPEELLNSFGEFASASIAPHARIYRNAQPNRIDAWLLELLRQARIGDRFFLRTGLEFFAWADCRVLDHRWLESLRRVIGPNQGFIAHDKNSAAMTIGAQYEMLGFYRGTDLTPVPAAPLAPPTAPLAPLTADPLAGPAPAQRPEEAQTARLTGVPVQLPDERTTRLITGPAPVQISDEQTVRLTSPPPATPADDLEATVLITRIAADTPMRPRENGEQ